ncbi:MAG: aspartyl protease family protein [Rhodanobacteraceae bacterium]
MIHSALVVGILSLVAAASCAAPSKPDQVIALDVTGLRPTAVLRIGAHRLAKVIFDTGAGTTVVPKTVATELNLPNDGDVQVGSPGATSAQTGMVTSISAAHLGEADIESGRAVALNLPDRLSEYGGIVSPNAFSGRIVRFEFAKSRAIVTDKGPTSVPSGMSLPYGGESGHPLPYAEVDFAGVKVGCHLDSGSKNGLSIPLEYAKRVPLKGPLVPTDPVRMIGGEHAAFTATLNGVVHVGPLALTDPQVLFVEGIPSIGNVGFQVLKNLTLVLDPQGQRSWLLPAD